MKPPEPLSEYSENGVTVQVYPADGTKCVRCRKWCASVEYSGRRDLCSPCICVLMQTAPRQLHWQDRRWYKRTKPNTRPGDPLYEWFYSNPS